MIASEERALSDVRETQNPLLQLLHRGYDSVQVVMLSYRSQAPWLALKIAELALRDEPPSACC